MAQSTNKTTNESDFTSSVWEKLLFWEPYCLLGVGYVQYIGTSTMLADVCFKVHCLKSLSNLVFTHLWNIDESIFITYFQQKTFEQSEK